MNGNGKKTYLVMTYNSITSYPKGTYESDKSKVIVQSEGKVEDLVDELRQRVNMKVDEVILYVGNNQMDSALDIASEFSHSGKNLRLVACGCSREKKERFARQRGLDITFGNCGGYSTLREVVKDLLN